HEEPSETRDTKIAALRLKFNAFKAFEDADVEEDTRSCSELLVDLNAEFQDRALLANQKRFYKRSGLVAESFDWDDESPASEDERVTRVKAFIAIAEDETVVGKADANYEKGGRGKKKEAISSKEVMFNKEDESLSKTSPEIISDSKSEYDIHEPLSPLPKLSRAEPIGTSIDVIPLIDLTLTPIVSNKTQMVTDKEKDDSSTEKLLLTLIEEVKGLKEQIKSPSDNFKCVSQTGSSKFNNYHSDVTFVVALLMKPLTDYLKRFAWYIDSRFKQYLHRHSNESCPKVVIGDKSLGDTGGYGLMNCNEITFTKVSFGNGLKHNLISSSQLCDANFKVLSTKTQGTIFNQNNEVVFIAPRKSDVYVIDMSSYNEESKSCFFATASNSNWLWHERLSHLNFKTLTN
ncbi:retrovirus-related pol polyprotein from transposon TNT 1-94, partial [Tanacetum coccineum]